MKVAIAGHVTSGKTTLMRALRQHFTMGFEIDRLNNMYGKKEFIEAESGQVNWAHPRIKEIHEQGTSLALVLLNREDDVVMSGAWPQVIERLSGETLIYIEPRDRSEARVKWEERGGSGERFDELFPRETNEYEQAEQNLVEAVDKYEAEHQVIRVGTEPEAEEVWALLEPGTTIEETPEVEKEPATEVCVVCGKDHLAADDWHAHFDNDPENEGTVCVEHLGRFEDADLDRIRELSAKRHTPDWFPEGRKNVSFDVLTDYAHEHNIRVAYDQAELERLKLDMVEGPLPYIGGI